MNPVFQCLVDVLETAHKNDTQLFVHIRVAMFSSISVLLQHARSELLSGKYRFSLPIAIHFLNSVWRNWVFIKAIQSLSLPIVLHSYNFLMKNTQNSGCSSTCILLLTIPLQKVLTVMIFTFLFLFLFCLLLHLFKLTVVHRFCNILA